MIPKVWKSNRGWCHYERLRREAGELAARQQTPVSKSAWEQRHSELRALLTQELNLRDDPTPPAFRVHKTIKREGYRIDLVSYASGSPDILVTAALYVPDGDGPFPAVLSLHGHNLEGKINPRIQTAGHVLVQNGFVVLSPDTPGSGERSVGEGDYRYHGAIPGASLYLIDDSLLAWQIRDNRRAVDVLCALPFVDADRIGVTGASGGGNQTMWVTVCDERIKASVPVVSAGTFESYVARRNCICETFPGGLTFMEEWELLGLIAPRPLLLINAYKEIAPAFGPESVTRTAEAVRELYALSQADKKFDLKICNTPHGYWPEMHAIMLGWMKYWLQGEGPGFTLPLPTVIPEKEENMLVFPPGTWPAETLSYHANKEMFLAAMPPADHTDKDADTLRRELAQCTGYINVEQAGKVEEEDAPTPEKQRRAVMLSPRGIPLPLVIRDQRNNDAPVTLIFGAAGKAGTFATKQFEAASTAIVTDLPGLGELSWEAPESHVRGATLHDTARACLWLGYTLAGEWAECVASLTRWSVNRFPGQTIKLVADSDAALAVLLAAALDPVTRGCELQLQDLPDSAVKYYRATTGSMATIIPGLLAWGDLNTMWELAR